jgi:hypothetical protein
MFVHCIMGLVRIRFTQSARRHRVAAGRARHIIDSPLVTLTLPSSEPGVDERLVFLGDDETGRALEVVAIVLPEYLLVIHVQDLQAKFKPYYEQAREEER